MSQVVVNLGDRAVADMLADPASLAIWEVARRLARAVTATEVAGILGIDLASAQRSLDWLEEFGLLARLPMRANRRVPAYRSTAESIVVMFDPADAMSPAWMERAVAAARDQVSRQLARCNAIQRNGVDPWTVNRHCSVHLDPGDLEEFRRLMAEVTGFLEAAQARVRKVDPDVARSVNVHLCLDAAAAVGPALPVPAVRFVPQGDGQQPPSEGATPGIEALSPREREVAMMLSSGRNRPEIARHLGVSLNTVGTLSKRIYAKLGVRRRAELSNRIRRRA